MTTNDSKVTLSQIKPEVVSDNIVNVKMNFFLIVYAAPGACRKAAIFFARPFASAGGGYSKRQIYLSFTIDIPLDYQQRIVEEIHQEIEKQNAIKTKIAQLHEEIDAFVENMIVK